MDAPIEPQEARMESSKIEIIELHINVRWEYLESVVDDSGVESCFMLDNPFYIESQEHIDNIMARTDKSRNLESAIQKDIQKRKETSSAIIHDLFEALDKFRETGHCLTILKYMHNGNDKFLRPVGIVYIFIGVTRNDLIDPVWEIFENKVVTSRYLMTDFSGDVCSAREFFQCQRYISKPDDGMIDHPMINRIPQLPPGEDPDEFARKYAMTDEHLEAFPAAFDRTGGNIALAFKLTRPRRMTAEPVRYLASRLLASSTVGVLVGASGGGKSTIAQQIAVDVASRRDVLGRPLGSWLNDDGLTVYLTGEDAVETVEAKLARMDPEGASANRIVVLGFRSELDLSAILDSLSKIRTLDMVILDTAAAAIGDVNRGDLVRPLMQRLSALAQAKGCVVLVLHHTNKNADLKSPQSVIGALKGSSEFISGGRAIYGFGGSGNVRWLAVCKSNLPSYDPLISDPIYLSYDPETCRSAVIDPPAPRPRGRPPKVAIDDASSVEPAGVVPPVKRGRGRPPKIAAAAKAVARRTAAEPRRGPKVDVAAIERIVADLTSQGETVTATGSRSLFGRKLPALRGLTGKQVADAVDAAIAAGSVRYAAGKLVAAQG